MTAVLREEMLLGRRGKQEGAPNLQDEVQQQVLAGHLARGAALQEHLAHSPYLELFGLPEPEAVKAGRVFLELVRGISAAGELNREPDMAQTSAGQAAQGA